MAVKKIGITTGGDIQQFQALTTDLVSTFPVTCGAGSTLKTINATTHAMAGSYYFDGTNWNTI